jgi:hypothetical protein
MTSQTETADVAKVFAYMDEAYNKMCAVPETITHNDPQNYDIPSQMGTEDVPTANLEGEDPNIRDEPQTDQRRGRQEGV